MAPLLDAKAQEEELYMREVIIFQSLALIFNIIMQLKAEQFCHIVKVLLCEYSV